MSNHASPTCTQEYMKAVTVEQIFAAVADWGHPKGRGFMGCLQFFKGR